MRRLRSLLIALTLAISWKASALTITIDANLLKTADGSPMPQTGLVLLVASTNDNVFNAPTALNFVSGDDILIGKWDLSTGFGPGTFQGGVNYTNSSLGSTNPLRLVWFPTLTLASVAPGQNCPYGTYTDAVGIDGSAAWFGASDNSTIGLKFFTTDADPNFSPPGSNPASAGNASQLTATAITINTQPASTTQNLGGTANFSVNASGTSLTYQWRKNGVNISNGVNVSGATTSSLTLSSVSASDVASYSVFITNSQAFVTSSNATLTVIDPYITGQPVSVTVSAGGTANFSVTASGTGSLTYQWKKGAATLSNGAQPSGAVVSGATTSALTISGVQQTDAANYSAVVTGTGGSTPSSVASLTITDVAPSFSSPTSDSTTTLNAGDQIILSVTATGSAPISYQWKKGASNLSNGTYQNGAVVSGATTANLTLNSVRATDAASYTCTAQNNTGSSTSFATTLIVNDPAIASQPASMTNECNGSWPCLSVTAVGSTNLTYQWYSGATAITDETNASLCFVDKSFASAGSYSVVVSNVYGNSITSSVATVTVVDSLNPSITLTGPATTNICKDSSWTEPGYSGDDLCDGPLTVNTSGSVDPSTIGTYTLTYTATDSHLNVGTVFRVVNVQNCGILDPLITKEPTNQIVTVGQKSVVMVMTATGTGTLRYQWFKKTNAFPAGAIKKATNATLPFALPIALKDQGTYYCLVTNGVGATNGTQLVTLTVYDAPKVAGPGNQTKIAGNIAIFKVTASPAPATNSALGGPFTFHWTRNGSPVVEIPNKIVITNTFKLNTPDTLERHSALIIYNVQSSDMATYLCTVSNSSYASATSPNDGKHGVLTVIADGNIPSAGILHPNNNLKTTNGMPVLISASLNTFQTAIAPQMDIDGSAADNGMVTNVALLRNEDNLSINVPLTYKINGAGFMKPGSVLWTNRVTLKHGTNTYRVVATDTAGLPSAGTAKRQYFFCTNVPVTISVTGTGTVKGVASAFGKPIVGANSLFDQIGYKLTASKACEWRTNNTFVTQGTSVSFIASSNLAVTAHFIP